MTERRDFSANRVAVRRQLAAELHGNWVRARAEALALRTGTRYFSEMNARPLFAFIGITNWLAPES